MKFLIGGSAMEPHFLLKRFFYVPQDSRGLELGQAILPLLIRGPLQIEKSKYLSSLRETWTIACAWWGTCGVVHSCPEEVIGRNGLYQVKVGPTCPLTARQVIWLWYENHTAFFYISRKYHWITIPHHAFIVKWRKGHCRRLWCNKTHKHGN